MSHLTFASGAWFIACPTCGDIIDVHGLDTAAYDGCTVNLKCDKGHRIYTETVEMVVVAKSAKVAVREAAKIRADACALTILRK